MNENEEWKPITWRFRLDGYQAEVYEVQGAQNLFSWRAWKMDGPFSVQKSGDHDASFEEAKKQAQEAIEELRQ